MFPGSGASSNATTNISSGGNTNQTRSTNNLVVQEAPKCPKTGSTPGITNTNRPNRLGSTCSSKNTKASPSTKI